MKKNISGLLLLWIGAVSLSAQLSFTGTADISLNSNIAESGDYSSLMNPGNGLGVNDAGINSSIIAKLDGGDEKTTFSVWFSLNKYQMGMAYYAILGDHDYATELAESLGDTIISFDVMRLSANVYLTDTISMEVGRQSMLTGYGYGWNPIDFANPLKNPLDPDAALRGVDGVSFNFFLGDLTALKVYGTFPQDVLAMGFDYEEIKAGGELTVYFPGIEVKLAGFYDYDGIEGSDAYTPSVGAGFIVDIAGAGLYGEAAVRKGSRNNFTDGVNIIGRKGDWLFSALAGIEYTFSNELYGVLEYYYNGEGYNNSERVDFKTSIPSSNVSSEFYGIYSVGYFARHYLMVNLIQPLYDFNTDLNFSAMFSPDSGSLILMPNISYSFSGNFSGKLAYTGMFDLYEDPFSEVTGQPVQHIVSAVFTYSF